GEGKSGIERMSPRTYSPASNSGRPTSATPSSVILSRSIPRGVGWTRAGSGSGERLRCTIGPKSTAPEVVLSTGGGQDGDVTLRRQGLGDELGVRLEVARPQIEDERREAHDPFVVGLRVAAR